ncbi:hypothetical protein CIG75_03215 [Tumebacillus algifaecis]|uniref:Uncharacterized protein n=1 Tax=Tumebacillus algifaecis TaxID=1214604 RepID=A0A223CXR7_9BACL|nr:hypothetical protein [Tumebacillus algifaecis]ASS74092.1 hypothetical protein CIG75_03215 [Tumebacillus algifaecis]
MSQKIILPNQQEIERVQSAVANNGKRLDSVQQSRYWNEPITRGEAQQAMGQIVNEALQSFVHFLGENFELTAKTPLGEQILQELETVQSTAGTAADEPSDH